MLRTSVTPNFIRTSQSYLASKETHSSYTRLQGLTRGRRIAMVRVSTVTVPFTRGSPLMIICLRFVSQSAWLLVARVLILREDMKLQRVLPSHVASCPWNVGSASEPLTLHPWPLHRG